MCEHYHSISKFSKDVISLPLFHKFYLTYSSFSDCTALNPVSTEQPYFPRPSYTLDAMNGETRNLLVTVDESSASDKVFDWALKNFYRAGDTVHILHVIAPARRLVVTPDMGLEGVIEDDEETRRKVEEHAQAFIKERFEKRLLELKVPYQVEIVRSCVDNDSIGALLCRRAEQLNAAVLLMAKHNRGAVKEFFIGSVSNYALHHCKQPVLVLHCD